MAIRKSVGQENSDEPVGLIEQTCQEAGCSRNQIAICLKDVPKTKYQLEEEGQRICQANNGLDSHTLDTISNINREYANKMMYIVLQGKTKDVEEKLIAYAIGNLQAIFKDN